MRPLIVRLALSLALVSLLAAPSTSLAAGRPADVETWQKHLAHMRSMGPNLGAHIADCIAMHGSMAGLLGPNGAMVDAVTAMNEMAAAER